MENLCEISITRSTQFGSNDLFGWSVRPWGLHADECAGSPFGAALKDIDQAVLEAVLEAKSQGFNGARIWSFMGKTLDAALLNDGFSLERAKKLVKSLSA